MILDQRFKKEEKREDEFFTESDLEKLLRMPQHDVENILARVDHAANNNLSSILGYNDLLSQRPDLTDQFTQQLMMSIGEATSDIYYDWLNRLRSGSDSNSSKRLEEMREFINQRLKAIDSANFFLDAHIRRKEENGGEREEIAKNFLTKSRDMRDLMYTSFAMDERKTKRLCDFLLSDTKNALSDRELHISLNGLDNFAISAQDRVDLSELVKNGIKYSNYGSPIKVEAENDRSHVHVSVTTYSKRGLDIEALGVENPEDVFKLGISRRDSSLGKGSGRGLYEAFERAINLGGSLEVEDIPVEGGYETTFTRSFPLYGKKICSFEVVVNGDYDHKDLYMAMLRDLMLKIKPKRSREDAREVNKIQAGNNALPAYRVEIYEDAGGTFVDQIKTESSVEERIHELYEQGIRFRTSFSMTTPGEYQSILDTVVKSSCDFRQRMGETRENNHQDIMEAIYHGTNEFRDIRNVTYSELNIEGQNRVRIIVQAKTDGEISEKTLYKNGGVEVVKSARPVINYRQEYLQPTG